jgi:uncharacterized protein YraI
LKKEESMQISPSSDPGRGQRSRRTVAIPFAMILLALTAILTLGALNGCAAGNSGQPTPTKTRKPTLTPIPPIPTATDLPLRPAVTLAPAATAFVTPTVAAAAVTTPTVAAAPTAAPAEAQLTITASTANARKGPSTDYDVVGKVSGGQSFKVTGKSAAGDWWQVCCVSEQPAWIAASLAQVTNGDAVPVVDAPAAAQAPEAAPTAAPVAAAPTARPAPTQPPAPPAAADPCANIGGDGCKWKVTGGPKTADNGGNELKLQFLFIHSGIDGGQPQGSYFVVMEKDGQRLPIPDSVRSIGLSANQGALGKYNYEFVLGLDKLPGGSVAGNYTVWVLDGNGERDSRNITFTISAGQGALWIQFDQA